MRGNVRLAIYSLSGRLVKTLVNEMKNAGVYKTAWNGRNNSGNKVVAGIYVCKLVNGGKMISKKITVIR
ncbi:MAG: T9SS type A sorting domain-containing protein, partial [Proteobacteria bacterium]|nr:T9SS type A sorting domain-containing protein [Pseudomonadota bacterium]